ncbi:MAG: peptidase, partial [Candidatus Didemnitutus sp.]|nr:peptidase [Candidatus Didemnitutus sp.]
YVTPKTAFIVLTNDDLNTEDGSTRFVFARHFHDDRLSIVSSARLRESFFDKLERPELTQLRLYKMIKKTIGLQYYGYSRSTDLKSVMYSPVMSLQDLDDHGTAF